LLATVAHGAADPYPTTPNGLFADWNPAAPTHFFKRLTGRTPDHRTSNASLHHALLYL